jgi:KDO2-lipid IV(A) lauroyltransferase
VPVRFFDGQARMAAGPAALALRTGAALLPTTLWFDGKGWAARIHPPVAHTDVPTMTQVLADAFADSISEHPADWHMLQRIWLDPGPDAAAEPVSTRPGLGADLAGQPVGPGDP